MGSEMCIRDRPTSATLVRKNPSDRNLRPRIPKLNAWFRPMPQKRIKNLTAEWYAGLLDRVAPPLPSDEWERLRDLALGRTREEAHTRQRRTRARAILGSDEEEEGDAFHYTWQREEMVRKLDFAREGHSLTARRMQRSWAEVFAQCPRMEWDSSRMVWKVEWGSEVLQRSLQESLTRD